ncbi:MAG: ABC transporter permease subunit [Desulfomicrobium sp.]|jgi:peptide/nickel transport system permease protein|nr:ABC transporter permease subunit [Desulfomicrobium sp.]NLV97992.1 ABC transporter permease subunit [Desulfovibrionales bacterium]
MPYLILASATKSTLPAWVRELGLTLRILSRNPSAVLGGMIIMTMAFLALAAPFIAPYDPIMLSLPDRLQSPGSAHFFGTDELGRDIFSRILYGARISLTIGLLVVGVAGITGSLIGAVAGYFGGVIDNVIMRCMDVILSFPALVLALSLAAAMGPSLVNAILATAVVMIPKFARLVRGEALAIREMPFVAASRVAGAGHLRIIFRHILPNCLNAAIVLATLTLGDAILIAASLSFIGLGAQPPTPEWGAMIASGRKFLMDQWWYATFPGLFILVTVIGFNIFGDAVRDVLDPRIRR